MLGRPQEAAARYQEVIDKAGAKPIVGTVDISAATQTDFTGRWLMYPWR